MTDWEQKQREAARRRGAGDGVATIAVVCTDRGQHGERVLGFVHGRIASESFVDNHPKAIKGSGHGYVLVGDDETPTGFVRSEEGAAIGPVPIAGMPGSSWQFWCPDCTRTPRITAARFQLLIDELRRVGRTRVDISHL